MCPRFMYGAVAAFVEQFAGARFERPLTETDRLHAFLFSASGAKLLAVYAPGDQESDVVVESDAREAHTSDPMGNTTAAAVATSVALRVGLYPVVVRLDQATTVTLR